MFKYYKDIYEGDIALIQYVPPNWQRFTALLGYCVTCVSHASRPQNQPLVEPSLVRGQIESCIRVRA